MPSPGDEYLRYNYYHFIVCPILVNDALRTGFLFDVFRKYSLHTAARRKSHTRQLYAILVCCCHPWTVAREYVVELVEADPFGV